MPAIADGETFVFEELISDNRSRQDGGRGIGADVMTHGASSQSVVPEVCLSNVVLAEQPVLPARGLDLGDGRVLQTGGDSETQHCATERVAREEAQGAAIGTEHFDISVDEGPDRIPNAVLVRMLLSELRDVAIFSGLDPIGKKFELVQRLNLFWGREEGHSWFTRTPQRFNIAAESDNDQVRRWRC